MLAAGGHKADQAQRNEHNCKDKRNFRHGGATSENIFHLQVYRKG
jgi:hypothetical protein